jgi:uncharacterized protein (DUF2267 family)
VRGIYFEGWRPSRVPEKIRSKQKFLDEVVMKLLPHPGEIADVIDQLPAEIKELWPEGARTFKKRTA